MFAGYAAQKYCSLPIYPRDLLIEQQQQDKHSNKPSSDQTRVDRDTDWRTEPGLHPSSLSFLEVGVTNSWECF